jgi:hypothetical protein
MTRLHESCSALIKVALHIRQKTMDVLQNFQNAGLKFSTSFSTKHSVLILHSALMRLWRRSQYESTYISTASSIHACEEAQRVVQKCTGRRSVISVMRCCRAKPSKRRWPHVLLTTSTR